MVAEEKSEDGDIKQPTKMYCKFCGAGCREAMECEDVRCELVPYKEDETS